MKVLRIKLDLTDVKLDESAKKLSSQAIFKNLFKSYCNGWANQAKQGEFRMTLEDKHLIYKIWDDLDKAIKEDAETVSLEDDRFGFMRRVVREVVAIAPDDLTRKFEEAIEEVKDR